MNSDGSTVGELISEEISGRRDNWNPRFDTDGGKIAYIAGLTGGYSGRVGISEIHVAFLGSQHLTLSNTCIEGGIIVVVAFTIVVLAYKGRKFLGFIHDLWI